MREFPPQVCSAFWFYCLSNSNRAIGDLSSANSMELVCDGYTTAILLTLYMVPVNLLDNILRPLVAKGLKTPMLVILIGVLGGTLAHGIIGLFVGPIVLSIAWQLLVVWRWTRRNVRVWLSKLETASFLWPIGLLGRALDLFFFAGLRSQGFTGRTGVPSGSPTLYLTLSEHRSAVSR